jgi:hypothetical protein
MFNLLRGRDQGEIRGRVVLVLAFLDNLLALRDEALHALARFALGCNADQRKHFFHPVNLHLGFFPRRRAYVLDALTSDRRWQ